MLIKKCQQFIYCNIGGDFMCGIAGFCGFNRNFADKADHWDGVLTDMRLAVKRRGPDSNGNYLERNVGLSHARLAIRDISGGIQPMRRDDYVIVYNGELYNSDEIKSDLKSRGFKFSTASDTEVILNAFIGYGADFADKLNGIFAFAVWDGVKKRLCLYRDQLGVKPLFYAVRDNTLIFGSELKALFAHPDVKPVIDINSLREVFGVGPARTPGNGVFRDVYELLPGQYMTFSQDGLVLKKYWSLESRPHEKSYADTVRDVAELVTDAIRRQMVSDVEVCSFLSGGVDSSIVTAVAAGYLEKLNTFSFDFRGNDEFFTANDFQPERDRPFVDKMLARYDLNHTYLECGEEELAGFLYKSADAKDLPGMADVDASLLYFCELVKQKNKVALTGECADEIFGGYPWFYRPELLNADAFPWSKDVAAREQLLSAEFRNALNLAEYADARYRESLAETPYLPGESAEESRRREVAYLNIQWFMQTLLTRMDRASMYSGLEARVPFADPRIVEYVWNVPWEMKCKDGVVKGLLRDAFKGLLPPELLLRKKSPYPKTYNPNYTRILGERLTAIIGDSSSPLVRLGLVDAEKIRGFVKEPQNLGKPWFGQLMAGPQMMAYLIQTDYWLGKYQVEL